MTIDTSSPEESRLVGSKRRTAAIRCGLNSLPLAGFVVLGLGMMEWSTAPSTNVLHAARSGSTDFDQDGLTNRTEDVLGSSKYIADTDADGFGDLEEFARMSDLADPTHHPLPSSLALNMSARGERDGLHVQFATFYTDAQVANKHFQFGAVVNGTVRFIPHALDAPNITYSIQPTADGLNNVLLVDVPFPEAAVHALGEISLFATLSLDSSPTIVAAAGVDLVSIDGIVTILEDAPPGLGNGNAQSISGGPGIQGTGPTSGSIYRPIPSGGGDLPQNWSPGMVCYQSLVTVGSNRGILTHEVVAADCISEVDLSCPSSCASSVGEVYDTFDPIGLIGG